MLIHAIKKVCSIKKVYFKNNSRSSPLLAVFIANIANFYFIFQIFPVPTLALDSRDNSASQFFFFFTTHVLFFLYQNTNFTFSVFLPFLSFVNFLRWKNNIKQNSRSYYERRWTWSYGNPGCPGRGQMRIPREILTSARIWNDQIQKRLGFTR